MNSNSEQIAPLNPRFAGAVFFALYTLLFLLFTKYTLLSLGVRVVLPLFPVILVALITGIFAGSSFGPVLAKTGKWYRPFLLGIALALFSLILFSLAILLHAYFNNSTLLQAVQHWKDYLVIYGTILLTLITTIGLCFIPLTGLIAIYFNKQFLPGLIAADKKRMEEENSTRSDRSDDKQ